MIDCHVHLAALRTEENGCYISPRMLRSPLIKFLAWKHNLNAQDAAWSNQKYVDDLLAELGKARYVEKAVLLGMDGVYDASGVLDAGKTEFLVSNDYVFRIAHAYPDRLWPGVSINPQRRDAIEELDRCVEAGAKLVKVLPNTQGFDPGNRKYIPFYRRLARHNIPFLSHVGYESLRADAAEPLRNVMAFAAPSGSTCTAPVRDRLSARCVSLAVLGADRVARCQDDHQDEQSVRQEVSHLEGSGRRLSLSRSAHDLLLNSCAAP